MDPDLSPISAPSPATVAGPSPFRTEVRDEGEGTLTVTVAGELDLVSIGSFQAAVEAVLASAPRRLVFDLRRCDFVSVRGYSVIGRCSADVDEVVVVAASEFVARVISLLGFDEVSTVVREPR